MPTPVDKNEVFLKGRLVILKVLAEADAIGTDWYGWFNNEELMQFMQKHYFPNTREAQLEYYRKEVAGNPSRLQLGICDAGGGPIVGVVSLNSIDLINRKAELSLIVADPVYRRLPVLVEIYQLMLGHAFHTLNLNRVYGGSIKKEFVDLMCRAIGFRPEGILRHDVYKDGRYHDVYLKGILREEFELLSPGRQGL